MVAIFKWLLLATTAAAVTSTTCNEVLNDLSQKLGPVFAKYQEDVSCFPASGKKGLESIHLDTKHFNAVLDDATEDVRHAGKFSSEDSCAILDESDKLAQIGYSLLDALTKKKADFEHIGGADSIREDLLSLNRAVLAFSEELICTVSKDQVKRAEDAKKKRATAFAKAIDVYTDSYGY